MGSTGLGAAIPPPPPLLSIDDVSQRYGRRTALSGVSLTLGRGVFGLLGPHGAGKSTLLAIMATVLRPTRGTVSIAGRPTDFYRSAREIPRNIGYLPQQFGYIRSLSIRDFVRYVAWLRQIPIQCPFAAADAAIDTVGLASRADEPMRTLCGGILQRVGIATAIVGDPDIVILDEPTVGLDPAQRNELRQLIGTLPQKLVIISTCLIEDVLALCYDMAILSDGKIIYRGTPGSLVSSAVGGVIASKQQRDR